MNRNSVWVDAKGNRWKVRAMTNEHLEACIRFLPRAKEAEEINMVICASMLRGEMAQDAADDELCRLMYMSVEEWAPIYEVMQEERARRTGSTIDYLISETRKLLGEELRPSPHPPYEVPHAE